MDVQTNSENRPPWWLRLVRSTGPLLILVLLVFATLPVYRYQSACRLVERCGWLECDRYTVDWLPGGGLVCYWNVRKAYFKRGTLDSPVVPALKPLPRGAVSRLAEFSDLKILVIAGWQVTQADLEEIGSLQSLTHLDVIRSNVTEDGAYRLSKALPACSIRFARNGDPRNNDYIRPEPRSP